MNAVRAMYRVIVLAVMLGTSWVGAAGAAEQENERDGALAPAKDASITGTVTVASDYVFRGISQTQHEPNVQCYFEYGLPSGFYVGAVAANVSGKFYVDGSIEMDLCVGKRGGRASGVTYDAGVVGYFYPGAETATVPSNAYDTTELYLVLTRRQVDVRYALTLTDWFGVDDAAQLHLTGTAAGDSRRSSYVQVTGRVPVGRVGDLALSLGRTSVRNYGDADFTDYRAALTRKVRGDFVLGLTWTGTNADERLFTVAGEDLGTSVVTVSVTRSF